MDGGVERRRARGRADVPASEMKNAWHAWLDRVEQGREEVVVTRYGRPVAKLVPYQEEGEAPSIFGFLDGTVTVHGDLVAPVDERWDADA